jgi:hypothetical protein
MLSTPASLGIEETSASFEARSAPRSYPTFVDQFPASGSSWKSFARGGEAVTIRDSPVKKVSKVAPRSVLASAAIRCRFVDRFVRLKVLSRVSRQRFSPHGTPLPSTGSR